MNGDVNFKCLKRDLKQDPSYATIKNDYRNVGIYNGDSVIQKLSDKNTIINELLKKVKKINLLDPIIFDFTLY